MRALRNGMGKGCFGDNLGSNNIVRWPGEASTRLPPRRRRFDADHQAGPMFDRATETVHEPSGLRGSRKYMKDSQDHLPSMIPSNHQTASQAQPTFAHVAYLDLALRRDESGRYPSSGFRYFFITACHTWLVIRLHHWLGLDNVPPIDKASRLPFPACFSYQNVSCR